MAWSSQARAAAAGVKRTGAVTAQDRALGVVCAASWANCPSRDLSGPAAGMPQYCWRHEPDAVAVDRAVSGDRPPRLSPPELTEAIRRLARLGLSASQIAARCGVTPRTVYRHVASHGIRLAGSLRPLTEGIAS